jgi:hypothetical protein
VLRGVPVTLLRGLIAPEPSYFSALCELLPIIPIFMISCEPKIMTVLLQ